jgi:peroxiredoxin
MSAFEQLADVLKKVEQAADWAAKFAELENAKGVDEETKELLIWATRYDMLKQLAAVVSGTPNFEISYAE